MRLITLSRHLEGMFEKLVGKFHFELGQVFAVSTWKMWKFSQLFPQRILGTLRRVSSKFNQFQVIAGISVFFICTSVISFCLKTLPGLRVEIPPSTFNLTSTNLSDILQTTATTLPPSSTTDADLITSTYRSTHRYSVGRS
jgi:hypothetical protein